MRSNEIEDAIRARSSSTCAAAPAGWQILNSEVLWYDPYQDHRFHKAVTDEDFEQAAQCRDEIKTTKERLSAISTS